MAPSYVIYCLVDMTSGRRYVGQTSMTLAERWWYHVDAAVHRRRGCRLLCAAIREVGPDVFVRVSLESVEGKDAANAAEKKWIAHYDCRAPNGFNLTRGGGGARRKAPETLPPPCRVCGEPATRSSALRARWGLGKGPHCDAHRSSGHQKGWFAAMTPAQQAAYSEALSRGQLQSGSSAWRRERAGKANAALTAEQRVERARKASAAAREKNAARTYEQRSASARKGVAARRGRTSMLIQA